MGCEREVSDKEIQRDERVREALRIKEEIRKYKVSELTVNELMLVHDVLFKAYMGRGINRDPSAEELEELKRIVAKLASANTHLT